MEIEQVDIVGAELAQAVLDILHDPLARLAAMIGCGADPVAEFGRDHPVIAVPRDGPPDHFLRAPAIIAVGGIDEIDAPFAPLSMIRLAVGSSVAPPNIMEPRQSGETCKALRPR